MNIETVRAISRKFQETIGLREDVFEAVAWEKFIRQRMAVLGINDTKAYCRELLRSPKEFNALLELVVVPETWFFREASALQFVVDRITRSNKSMVQVLDAACSTGEEPYSLVMLLHEQGIPSRRYAIKAVDISAVAIEKAKKGEYRSSSFRGKNEYYKNRYFEKRADNVFLLHEDVRKEVHFSAGNLLDPSFMKGCGEYDIVVCRNLFIYLSIASQTLLLKKIASLLTSGGLLFLGATEGEIARRSGWTQAENAGLCAFLPPGTSSALKKPVLKLFSHKSPAASWLEHLDDKKSEKEEILMRAVELANEGCYDEALVLCCSYVGKGGKKDPEAYFLMGVIEHAYGRLDAAEDCFSKALYLLPNHAEALAYLTLLAEQRGDGKKALLYRQRLERIGGRS